LTRKSTTKIIDRTKSAFTVLLSVPKTIGKGPMIIAPPPPTFFSPFVDEKSRKITAIKTTMTPVRISMKPKVDKRAESIIEIHCLYSERAKF